MSDYERRRRQADYLIKSGGGDLLSVNLDPAALEGLVKLVTDGAETARQQIAKGGYQTSPGQLPYEDSANRVMSALLADGWVKPREVSSLDDLRMLRVDAVVFSDCTAYQNYGDDSWAGAGRFYDVSQITLPVVVLHEPS